MRARFGTAGNPDGFYQAGKKQSKDMPPWLREQGLEAYEYQCGKGVTVGEATARAIGRAAAGAGIALSLHAPYFVNPANPDPDSQEKTLGHVLKACQVAQWMGADRVVVHTGALQKRTREEALATAKAFFQTLRRRCDEAGYGDIPCARRPWERSTSWGIWRRSWPSVPPRKACCPAWISATSTPAPWAPWTGRRR